jgi:hypothetical protein
MKVLKKLTLVAAISAASISAQAEMTAIDDALMGDITGQAGVTIEMETSITIDKVTYTDTDDATFANNGSVGINGIAIGGVLDLGDTGGNSPGATFGANFVTGGLSQVQTIDVSTDGDLLITSTAGNNGAFALTVGSVTLEKGALSAGQNNALASNLYLEGTMGDSVITVNNGGVALYGENTVTSAAFGAAEVSIDMESSIEITNAGATITLGTGSIGISGVSFNDGGAGNAASMTQNISARAQADGVDATANTADDIAGGLVIQSGQITGDLTIGSITLGSGIDGLDASIGSISVAGIDMAGSTMVIYGH